MVTLRRFLSLFTASLALCIGAPASAEILTATFAGIATGYDNTVSYPGTSFVDNAAWGYLELDPSKFSYHNGSFYAGADTIRLTFHVNGHTEVWGGLEPNEQGTGFFDSSIVPGRQEVALSSSSCGFCSGAGMKIVGPANAFGPDENLSPMTFQPGPVFLDQSTASFGSRYFGASFDLTSISMTRGPITVTSSIPEPSTYALMLAGLGLLTCVLRRGRRAQGNVAHR